jgi:hypothetical protein
MRVSHLARYGGKPACTSFEVAITLCRDSHEAHVHEAISRETANSCMSYAKPWHIAIVHAACIPNTIISRPRSSEVLASYLTASILIHMPAVPPLFRCHQLPLGTHVIHNGLVWHTLNRTSEVIYRIFCPPRVDRQPISPLDHKFIWGPSRNLCQALSNMVQGKATFPELTIAIKRAGSHFDSEIFPNRGPPFDVRNNEKSRLQNPL